MKEKLQQHARRLHRFIRTRRLVFALSVAIVASLGLTVVSIAIYNIGGYYRYDLSRPGYEKERQEIAKTPTNVTYDTTSPLSKQAIDAFLSELDKHTKNLNAYDTFGDGGLSDEDLQLNAGATAPQ